MCLSEAGKSNRRGRGTRGRGNGRDNSRSNEGDSSSSSSKKGKDKEDIDHTPKKRKKETKADKSTEAKKDGMLYNGRDAVFTLSSGEPVNEKDKSPPPVAPNDATTKGRITMSLT